MTQVVHARRDITYPGDPLIGHAFDVPVGPALDDAPTKYIAWDPPVGFAVQPLAGPTTVTGLAIQSADDAPERDPKVVLLEGSNETGPFEFLSDQWELIVRLEEIPPWERVFPGNHRYRGRTV